MASDRRRYQPRSLFIAFGLATGSALCGRRFKFEDWAAREVVGTGQRFEWANVVIEFRIQRTSVIPFIPRKPVIL